MNYPAGRKYGSITTRILAMKFASEFILIYPLYTIMFGDRGGLTAANIGAIISAGFVFSVVFELPTGVIADKIPRKYVLVLGILCKILALAAWLTFPTLWGYLLGIMLFSLANAFESGALQAYLYGTLGGSHKSAFGKFWSRVHAMVMVSYTCAFVMASIIGVHYPVLLLLSIAACSAGLAICLTLPKDTLHVKEDGTKPKIIASAFNHILGSANLRSLLLGSVIAIALAETMIEFGSLYNKQVGAPVRILPILQALSALIGAGLFWTLSSWETFLNKHKIFIAFCSAAVFALSFFGGVVSACVGFIIATRFVRVLQVQFESNIQHLSNDEARATISSVGSFGGKLGAALVIASIGFSASGNIIVRPFRIALLCGLAIFMLTQLAANRRGNRI